MIRLGPWLRTHALLIFWLVVIVLVFGAFAVEAAFRHEVCISAMTQELGQPAVTVPVVCE